MKLVYILIYCFLSYSICNSEVLWEYTKKYDGNLMISEQIEKISIENGNISFISNYAQTQTFQFNFEIITLSENGELMNVISPSFIPYSNAKNWVRIGDKIRVYSVIVPLSDTLKYGYCDYDQNGNRLNYEFYVWGGSDTNFRQYLDIKDNGLLIHKTIPGKTSQLLAYCDFDLNEKKIIEIEQIEDTTVNNNWFSIVYEPTTESYIKIHYKKGQISSLNSTLAYISKHDKNGKFIWMHKIENTAYDSTQINEIAVFDDGSFAVYGTVKKYKDIEDYIVVKFDKDNNLISETTIKRDVNILNDLVYNYVDKNNFYAVGQKIDEDHKSSQFYIKSWDFSGNLTGEYTWQYGSVNFIYRIYPLQNDEMYVGGRVNKDTLYFAKIKFQPTSVDDNIKNGNALEIYPNPAGDYIVISIPEINPTVNRRVDGLVDKIRIFNTLGIDLTPALSINGEGVRIDVSRLPAGVYFIRIGDIVEKFVKM